MIARIIAVADTYDAITTVRPYQQPMTFARAVERINELEASMQALTDDELKAKTAEYRHRFADGETLDALLPEAFATVRVRSR